MQKRHPNE